MNIIEKMYYAAAFRTITGMILAGAAISLGAYMSIQFPGPIGAILFSIGLMSVCTFGFPLYTGRIKDTDNGWHLLALTIILAGNIVGCLLMSLWASYNPDIIPMCDLIIEQRTDWGFMECMARGAGCGYIMTLAVITWRKNPWPLLIGIPAFVLCGFTHSVADAFYYSVGWKNLSQPAMLAYLGTVIGNFIGGLIFKLGRRKSDDNTGSRQSK